MRVLMKNDYASMRPGQSCPGVDSVCDTLRSRPDASFNEAGAIMPRSGSAWKAPARGRRCFNEAGAIMPRSGWPCRDSTPWVPRLQ